MFRFDKKTDRQAKSIVKGINSFLAQRQILSSPDNLSNQFGPRS